MALSAGPRGEDASPPARAPAEDTRSGEPSALEHAMDFVLSVDRLKHVRRRSPVADGRRRERTAEHSWHVALAVLCLREFAAEEIDVDRAIRLAVVHDLPEAFVGDTFVYGTQTDRRRSKEGQALAVALRELSPPTADALTQAWTDYEYERTPEGRFVMAVDVVMPIFLNLAAGRESSWVKYGVRAADVRARIAHVQRAAPALARMALDAVALGVRRGLLDDSDTRDE